MYKQITCIYSARKSSMKFNVCHIPEYPFAIETEVPAQFVADTLTLYSSLLVKLAKVCAYHEDPVSGMVNVEARLSLIVIV